MEPNQTFNPTPLENNLPPLNKQNAAPQPTLLAEPASAHRPQLKNALVGGAFLTVSTLGALGLIIAYLPITVPTPVEVQAAAATEAMNYFADVDIAAKGAYVYDIHDDKELFAKNANAQLPLASITKVALVLSVAEVVPLNATVTVSKEAVERGGGGLTWGEEWKAHDLIDFTLITSSNTGAEALAEAAAPMLAQKYPEGAQGNATVWRMNSLAQSLGMHETYFINPTGLDESQTQAGAQSSAKDIATLFSYALRTNKELFAGTTRAEAPLGPTNFPEREAINTNNALSSIPGIVMGKTGTTDLAGGNLAIVFEPVPGHPVAVVVLGSTTEGRFEDVKKLVSAATNAITGQKTP